MVANHERLRDELAGFALYLRELFGFCAFMAIGFRTARAAGARGLDRPRHVQVVR